MVFYSIILYIHTYQWEAFKMNSFSLCNNTTHAITSPHHTESGTIRQPFDIFNTKQRCFLICCIGWCHHCRLPAIQTSQLDCFVYRYFTHMMICIADANLLPLQCPLAIARRPRLLPYHLLDLVVAIGNVEFVGLPNTFAAKFME